LEVCWQERRFVEHERRLVWKFVGHEEVCFVEHERRCVGHERRCVGCVEQEEAVGSLWSTREGLLAQEEVCWRFVGRERRFVGATRGEVCWAVQVLGEEVSWATRGEVCWGHKKRFVGEVCWDRRFVGQYREVGGVLGGMLGGMLGTRGGLLELCWGGVLGREECC
jgi:hypothetical protein